jgi:hypothetical protein
LNSVEHAADGRKTDFSRKNQVFSKVLMRPENPKIKIAITKAIFSTFVGI